MNLLSCIKCLHPENEFSKMANNPTASSQIFGEGLTLVYIIRYVDILLVVFRHSSYRCHLASAWPYYGRVDVWGKGFFCSWQRQKSIENRRC